jgi:hypothetical protein
MLSECPACHARATLAPDRELVRVRCGECGRIFVAHPSTARPASSSGRILRWGVALAVVAALCLVLLGCGVRPLPH